MFFKRFYSFTKALKINIQISIVLNLKGFNLNALHVVLFFFSNIKI